MDLLFPQTVTSWYKNFYLGPKTWAQSFSLNLAGQVFWTELSHSSELAYFPICLVAPGTSSLNTPILQQLNHRQKPY